jgi:hypothetical protein
MKLKESSDIRPSPKTCREDLYSSLDRVVKPWLKLKKITPFQRKICSSKNNVFFRF